MTGIYFWINRSGKWEKLDLSELTEEEIRMALATFDKQSLIRTVIEMLGVN